MILPRPVLQRLLTEFVHWYYFTMPLQLLKRYAEYVSTLAEIFSFSFLLRTLLSPWKGIVDAYPARGFKLNEILATFALNCTARAIGAVIRLTTIFVGLVVQALGVFYFLAYLTIWLLFPVLLPLGVLYLLFSLL